MPMGKYETFEECEKANQDKKDPAAYCGEIKKRTEDVLPPACMVKRINILKENNPEMDLRTILKMAFERKTNDFVEDFIEIDVNSNEYKNQIEFIKNYYKEIPKNIRKSVKTLRIVEKITNRERKDSLGYYDYSKNEIVIALKTKEGNLLSDDWLEQNIVHEFAHPFYHSLSEENKDKIVELWHKNKGILREKKVYAGITRYEFFAEMISNYIFGYEHRFKDLTSNVKGFFGDIIKKHTKGKGWHGESERHSQAAKKGKIDFTEVDFTQPQTLDLIFEGIALQFDAQFDESKGRWITIKGKHVFIKKGEKLTFGEGGRYKKVKITAVEKLKRKIEREGIEKGERPKTKIQEKKAKEEEREAKQEAKEEERKRKQVKRERKRIEGIKHKKVPEISEKEKKIQRIIEKKGFGRKRAEEEYERKYPKKVPEDKIKDKVKEKEKQEKKEIKIKKKTEVIQSRLGKLKILNKTFKSNALQALLDLTVNFMSESMKENGDPNIQFGAFIEKIRRSKNLTQKQRETTLKQIAKLRTEISNLQEDFIYDAEMPSSKILEGETRLQKKFEQLREYEKAYGTEVAQALREQLGEGVFTPTVEGISVPFRVRNSETGAVVRGSVMERFDKNTKQLRPVSSSNVRGVGQFGDEMLVQFHSSKKATRKTYRYKFDSPETAEEATRSLTESGSPGRWIWENIRGHRAGEATGEKKVPHKYGPSLSPPGQGKNVIGGTRASLVKYSISNRVPVSRVEKFDEMSKQMKRKTSSPTKDPQTGSRIEALLGIRKGLRAKGLKRLDFTVRELDANDLELDFDTTIPGKWITTKYGGKVYIYDDPKQAPKKPEYYTPEELNIYQYQGEEIGIVAIHEVEAWLQVDRRVSMKDVNFGVGVINRIIESLPLNIKKMINEVRVYNKVTDDPAMWEDKGKVPNAYKQVGWKRTYDEISGVYVIGDNNVILTPDAWESVTRHEIGHAVWYGISIKDKDYFLNLWRYDTKGLYANANLLEKQAKIFDKDDWRYEYYKNEAEGLRYEANDVEEYFAESFKRFYEAKRPIYPWQGIRYQKQLSPEVGKFFRERMKKYEKD